jgi:hypothetical protein
MIRRGSVLALDAMMSDIATTSWLSLPVAVSFVMERRSEMQRGLCARAKRSPYKSVRSFRTAPECSTGTIEGRFECERSFDVASRVSTSP